ncbi:TPA: hypothetical protein EYP75_03085 [Candidatus Bathyarchaeota archaeon]|nr:hypothetical protein [Candidatus Bathyarchaeota archaeon]
MEDQTTASAIISFAEKLENSSSKFYIELSKMYKQERETFIAFAKESEKNKVLIKRTYQETISDALEACFSFEGLNLQDYLIETDLKKDMSYIDALKMAIELEEKAGRFYMDVAERSGSLLATIPRAFRKAAEVRNKHKLKLKKLLEARAAC